MQEYLIHEWNETSSHLHNELIKLYKDYIIAQTELQEAESKSRPSSPSLTNYSGDIDGDEGGGITSTGVREKSPSPVQSRASSESSSPVNNNNTPVKKTLPIVRQSIKDEPPHPDLCFDLGLIRKKMLEFLHNSTHYTPPTILLSLSDHSK